MTQENWAKPDPELQTLVNIRGEDVWIDDEFVVLIQELNRLGLITRSHCAGHESNISWIVIRMGTITNVEIRNDGEYKELLIHWRRGK
jgi:hypothetical protein